MQKINQQALRILDANFNRAKEGLRVCEDILRFILDSAELTNKFKSIRHKTSHAFKMLDIKLNNLLAERDILEDVGKKSFSAELKRKNVSDIFFANMQRLKESVRVLEEFSKLINRNAAIDFKLIRYKLYQLEKEAIKKFPTLSNLR